MEGGREVEDGAGWGEGKAGGGGLVGVGGEEEGAEGGRRWEEG